MSLYAIILCAGKGSRMGGERQKTLLPVLGTPMARHVAAAVSAAKPSKTVAVVGFEADKVIKTLSACPWPVEFAVQKNRSGTGGAARAALEKIRARRGDAVVINGDMPAVTGALVRKLVRSHKKSGAAVTVVTAETENPRGYGRIVRGAGGKVKKIAEEADATPEEKRLREINAGIYCFKLPFLHTAAGKLGNKNALGEYYITDLVEAALSHGETANTVTVNAVRADFEEVAGVNTPEELAAATARMRDRTNTRLMSGGVVITDPQTTFICPETTVGSGTVIHPCCFIVRSRIGKNCSVGPCSKVVDGKIGNGCAVEFSSLLDGCEMRENSSAGPFARIRPGTVLMDGAKAGTFVEIKKSTVGRGSKVPHLSYVGDTEVGSGANIGAGTVTCNFDGKEKHRTVIEDGAFIGSDTMLVAPVTVGAGAVTGAGSVITRDVPPGSLAIGRSRQKEITRRGAGGGKKRGGKN